jgi:hypothetical protein
MKVVGIEVFEYFIDELGNEDLSHHDDLCDPQEGLADRRIRRRLDRETNRK